MLSTNISDTAQLVNIIMQPCNITFVKGNCMAQEAGTGNPHSDDSILCNAEQSTVHAEVQGIIHTNHQPPLGSAPVLQG